MQRGRGILIQAVVLLVVLGAAVLGAYYWYQAHNYVTTADAQVSAPTAPLGAPAAGVLVSWTAHVGQRVKAGQVLGQVRVASAASVPAAAGSASATAKGGKAAATAVSSSPATLPVRAPLAGVVVNNAAVRGAVVAPGVPLGYVGALARIEITAYVKETRIRHVAVGQSVRVRVDALPGTTLRGRVRRLGLVTAGTFSLLPTTAQGGSFTPVTQRIPVHITLQGVPAALVPGESATVRIHTR